MRFNKRLEATIIDGLCHILRRTDEVNTGDQRAIAQEYKEWINCIDHKELQMQEILFINKSTFPKYI